MRFCNMSNLLKFNRLIKLRKDFKTPWAAFVAASGLLSRTYVLLDKAGNRMHVNRDDLFTWSVYFKGSDVCKVDILSGLFYVNPTQKNHPSYYIQGSNSKLTYQPKRWCKQPHPLISELQQSEQKFFSQHGEDGVIQKILSKIPVKHQYLIEFGAHDGLNMSNSRYLIEMQDWKAFLIEGDSRFFKKLSNLYFENKNVTTQKTMLTADNINQVFRKACVPTDFDFLCIDVDGPDYYLWEALTEYTPSIVMVEYNSIIPPNQDYVVPEHKINEWGGTSKEGAGLLSFCKLGKKKGYTPIYTELSGSNLFFIHSRHKALFDVENITIEMLYQPPQFGELAGGVAPNGRGYK